MAVPRKCDLGSEFATLIGRRLKSKPILVTVGEGKKKEEFYLHEAHLRSSSDFFQKALSTDWKEGSTGTVELAGSKPQAFEAYVKWLYTGRIHIMEENDRGGRNQNGVMMDTEFTKIMECYALGDFLQDLDFKDAVVDACAEKMASDDVSFIGLGQMIYPRSLAKSPHRKFAVDTALHTWDLKSFSPIHREKDPSEFLLDLLAAVAQSMRTGGQDNKTSKVFFASLTPCEYHEHTLQGKPCYSEKSR
ncbi:hypothetical protein BDV95DRAFT_487789 [Massariosphaeria phaeospora]|uniref:BTB domain-containing protein n=1 Tax=Massariosphaeria phaeospora TaxID=100035 RepID=A0A7C8I9J2_9PLEO|nr:hypothetical protein BDV95DRAFT_487789 [Massariosphaeria phaeospora]